VNQKMCHFILVHNSHIPWQMFTIFAPVETGRNTVHIDYNLFHFTLILSPHYLVKLWLETNVGDRYPPMRSIM